MMRRACLLVLCLMVGCHRHVVPHAPHEGTSAWWPVDPRATWLDQETREALLGSDPTRILSLSTRYAEPRRMMLQVEAYHRLKFWDEEARVLERLCDQGFLSTQEASVVLSRYPQDAPEPKHSLAKMAWLGQHYWGASWWAQVRRACQEGHSYACVPEPVVPQRVVLLLPKEGSLAKSAQSFREGFMAAVMAYDPEISVRVLDSEQSEAALASALSTLRPDWVVGPMGKTATVRYAALKLPYRQMALGECEHVAEGAYCFSLSSTAEVVPIAQRLRAMGIDRLSMLYRTPERASGWLDAWAQLWPKTYLERHQLKDKQWLDLLQRTPWGGVPRHASVLYLTMPEMKEALRDMAQSHVPPHMIFAPSLWAKPFQSVGVDYFDARMMLDIGYKPPVWGGIAPFVMRGSEGAQQRFLAWGMDAFMLLAGYGHELPYVGGTGLCYWHGSRVVRALDVAALWRGGHG